MGELQPGQPAPRSRREQLDLLLAAGQARLERARTRSRAVDAAVDTLRRERPVASGILAGALAFRVFALLIPLAYVLVAGLGFSVRSDAQQAGIGHGDHLGDLVVDSIAAAAETSQRGRWVALVLGGVATLVAAGGVVEVLRWIHVLAWRITPPRERRNRWLFLALVAGTAVLFGATALAERTRAAAQGLGSELWTILATAAAQVVLLAALWLALSMALPRPPVPWTALVPGALLFAGGFQAFSLSVSLYFAPWAARASTVYGSLGVALVLLASLFLVGRLAVTAAELNATLWERRAQRRRPNAPPP
jgi:uncharacterized BrkB/YihY/UPF0761 family membrane protein